MSELNARRAVALIVTLFLILGVAYSIINPIFESPDESLNYANIRFLVREKRLPVLKPDEPTKAHHPPAYYAIAALLTSWVPNEHFDDVTNRVNAFWIHRVGEAGVDNKTLYLHNPALEGFPYRDVALGVHLVRWLSLVMGAGTVLLIYGSARELMPSHPELAVMATSLVAFNPMFLFISASVHDDALANLVATAVLYTTARLLRRGPTMRQAVALGALLGVAVLTKLTCLLVAPAVGLALLMRCHSPGEGVKWHRFLRLGGVITLLALLIGGWWLVRNLMLYGEPTSMGRQVEAWGGFRPNAPDFAVAVRELGFLHDSFWGVFGYGQIPMPGWAYMLPRLLGILSIGGWLLLRARRRAQRACGPAGAGRALRPRLLLVLVSAPLPTFLVVFFRMAFIGSAHFGRYLHVSLGFLVPLYVLGLAELSRDEHPVPITVAVATALFALAVFALIGVVHPAYAPPRMLSAQEVQNRVRSSDLQFGEAVRLVGHQQDVHRAQPGDQVKVTLCWESLAPMEENYVYFIHFLGRDDQIVGARTTHPGLGRYPTRRWAPGDRFCDVVDIYVDRTAPAPAVYDVQIGWHGLDGTGQLPAFGPEGTPVELVLLDHVAITRERAQPVIVPHRLRANLGDQITLLGYDIQDLDVTPGDSLRITLYWEAQASLAHDYTVFLHLAPADRPPYAQDDGQPRDGAYPTSFWDVGETVTETRTISIPAELPSGEYPLWAGMYLLETGERLPQMGPEGEVQGDAVLLGTITVKSRGS